LCNQSSKFFRARRRISGGRSRKRLRELFVVEEFNERDIGLTLVFCLEPVVKSAQLAILSVFLKLPVPFAVSFGVKPALQLHKLSREQLGNGLFDFSYGTHEPIITHPPVGARRQFRRGNLRRQCGRLVLGARRSLYPPAAIHRKVAARLPIRASCREDPRVCFLRVLIRLKPIPARKRPYR